MVSLADRLATLHPNLHKKIPPDTKYLSAGLKWYKIRQDEQGYWTIVTFSRKNKAFHSKYTSFKDAERVLIAFLKRTDKFGNKAVYPEYG